MCYNIKKFKNIKKICTSPLQEKLYIQEKGGGMPENYLGKKKQFFKYPFSSFFTVDLCPSLLQAFYSKQNWIIEGFCYIIAYWFVQQNSYINLK